MANFETWKFDSLVQFAREAQERITFLEAALAEQRGVLAECAADRKDLLDEMRKLIRKELQDEPK